MQGQIKQGGGLDSAPGLVFATCGLKFIKSELLLWPNQNIRDTFAYEGCSTRWSNGLDTTGPRVIADPGYVLRPGT